MTLPLHTPPAAGAIDWSAPAADIGLDFTPL